MTPIGRLAPSPTGQLHPGHARTFLLAWWHVRSRNGRIVLRIEDLDTGRVRPEAIDATRLDLEWLGIDWDGAAELQSDGLERIESAARDLVGRGLAYACTCSRADVRAAQSAPQLGDHEPRYPGTCRERFATPADAERISGRPAGLRFRVPDEDVAFTDVVAGARSYNVQRDVGDFLISRRDHAPAYQLAVVVDDARQGVNEVLRGDDLLSSTPRQRLLQRALGLPQPSTAHVPLVLDEAGQRLAKRRGDPGLTELRLAGADPRAVVAWAAESAGQATGGAVRCTAGEIVGRFDLTRVPRNPVRLTRFQLEALASAR